MVRGESQAFLLFLYGCRMYDVTGADTYEIRHCPYIDVNVVPDSQRRQKMNPHLTSIYISSYRYSARAVTKVRNRDKAPSVISHSY